MQAFPAYKLKKRKMSLLLKSKFWGTESTRELFLCYVKYFLKYLLYLKELKTVTIKYLITTIIKNSTIAFSEKFYLTLNLFLLKDKGDHFLYTICFFT